MINKKSFGIFLILAFIFTDFIVLYYISSRLGFVSLSNSTLIEILIFSTIILSTVSVFFTYSFFRFDSSKNPIAHNVAIVGFPKSGKTTLIITLFGEIFAQRISKFNATLKTTSTIDRVNEYLAKLHKGLSVGPTTDQDMFAYRTNIVVKNSIFSQTYKVEFGDFPGENTEDYIKQYGPWLHTTPFFKWISSADVVAFVIDIGKYLDPNHQNDYIANISSSIRAAWQHVLNTADEGSDAARSRQVILIFTKSDLFEIDLQQPEYEITDNLNYFGFGEKTPDIAEISTSKFIKGKEKALHDFDDLIVFLENDTKTFEVVFTSSFATINGERIGANELLSATLPKHRSLFF